MGTKYSTQTVSGYNSSPPPDDGSKIATNVLKWSNHISKIGNPILTLAQAINTTLLAHLDEGPTAQALAYSVVAGDYNTTVELAGVNCSLLAVATAGKGFRVRLKNTHASNSSTVTVSGAGTIDGASSVVLPPKTSSTFIVNAAASEYFEVGHARPSADAIQIPSGTKMGFFQSAVPTGWTQVVTWNDVVPLIVNDGTGGGTGGSWTISGLAGTQPTHTHGGATLSGSFAQSTASASSGSGAYNANSATVTVTISGNTQSAGNDAVTVTHTPGWRPSYVKQMVCSKN